LKAIRLHWTLHDAKCKGLYHDTDNKPRSEWYDEEIENKKMSKSAVARELDISYEGSVDGIIFQEFARRLHVYKGEPIINPHLPVIRYFDYGACGAVVFSQVDKYNRINVFHEIVIETQCNAKRLGDAAIAYSNTLKAKEFRDFDDPAGQYDGWVTGTPSIQILNELGIYPTHTISAATRSRRTARIEMIHQKLGERSNTGAELVEAVQIHESCKFLIDAFEGGYRHPMNSHGEINIDDVDEIHPYEDVMDCFGGTLLETMSIHKPIVLEQPHVARNPYTGR
jgi:hypothetical protein